MNNRFKKYAAKAALAVLSPLLFFGLAEGALRLIGYGHPNELLVPASFQCRPMWTGNPFYTYRFFAPPIARVPSPILVAQDKPPGEIRIVVLGESAAQGDPVPAFGVCRMLEVLLRERFSDDGIQVVNAAITAISTAVIRDLSLELDKLEPDVVLLYMGNNEVIGPYGPTSPISALTRTPFLQRAAVGLTRLRVVQAVQALASLAAEQRGPVVFEGVAKTLDRPVSHVDPRLTPMRRRFESHVREIAARARQTGAHVLVSTVAVNYTDCPPAISMHRPGLPETDRRAWENHMDRGVQAFQAGRWALALESFERAAAIDDHPAELAYRRAECLNHLGRDDEAQKEYTRAMDLDAFRYRTDSALNTLLRNIATTETNGVVLVDANLRFRNGGHSRDRDWFVDHVHFSFEGTWQLATTLGDALLAMPPLVSRTPAHPNWMPLEDVRQRMGFGPVAESSFYAALLGRYRQPPFNAQYNTPRRITDISQRLEQLSRQMSSPDPDQLRRDYSPYAADDPVLASLWASTLIFYNRYNEAMDVLAPLLDLYPSHRELRARMAEILLGLERPTEAADILVGWTPRHGFLAVQTAETHLNRLIETGQMDVAADYAQALVNRLHRLDYPWRIRAYIPALADLRAKRDQAFERLRLGDPNGAARIWADLMNRHPTSPLPPYALAVHEASQGNTAQAKTLLQTAIRRWNYPQAQFYAGLWEAHFGDPKQARQLLRNAHRFAGDDAELHRNFACLHTSFPQVPSPAETAPAPALSAAAPPSPPRTPWHLLYAGTPLLP